ncbi:hypothetical protein [Amycolatopsis nivea]|uniref:hypothetical protein n=1 Tax=Amycolatopsis nivea TaxID=1644109 RepID=UPI00196ABCFE|nr:hypothetical protein [Amycolatopsis nivea]
MRWWWSATVTVEELRAFARERFAGYKVPEAIEDAMLDAIPNVQHALFRQSLELGCGALADELA